MRMFLGRIFSHLNVENTFLKMVAMKSDLEKTSSFLMQIHGANLNEQTKAGEQICYLYSFHSIPFIRLLLSNSKGKMPAKERELN